MSRIAARLLRRGLLLFIASLLAWRVVALGVAEYHARRADPGAATRALAWHPHHSRALYRQALAVAESDPARAAALLGQAAREDPTDGRVFMQLALRRAQQGELQAAENLAATATRLTPMRSDVRLAAAAFWLQRDRLEQVLEHWSVALAMRQDIRAEIYPVLLGLAEDPRTRALLRPWLDEPPPWWAHFFHYAAANAADPAAVDLLYRLGRHNGRRPHGLERYAYLDRLQREGRWLEMYFVWLNGLDDRHLAALGLVFDGGFELPLSNAGFGWRSHPVRGVSVETAATYGVEGERALRLIFRKPQTLFRHLSQYLLLEPGGYRLSGLARPDGLRSGSGLQWTLRCAGGGGRLLGASERFLGSSQWREFAVTFTVPGGSCRAQELRLELTGRTRRDFEAVGTAWFDRLRIVRVTEPLQ